MTLTLELLERALDQTGSLIDGIHPADQGQLPTPCTDWDVRTLVNHTVYDLQTFARQLDGRERGPADADLIGGDWPAAYRAAAATLLETWRRQNLDGVLRTRIGEFPMRWAIGQHLADVAVHGWDVARATGQQAALDPQVGQAALDWARENLKPQFRGAAFGPEVPASADAPLYDRLAAYFGRPPDWTRPQAASS